MAYRDAQSPDALPTGLPRAPLHDFCEDERFRILDRSEAYARGKQDEGKRYTWDGMIMGGSDMDDVDPGWYVPHVMRRPRSRFDVAKLIVRRLTSFTFGEARFPEIRVPGDDAAEDFARELAKEARLAVRLREARNFGGGEGSACLSFGFVNGKPRIRVHNPKHVRVMTWVDEDERIPREVFKAFCYPRTVFDPVDGKAKIETFWTARWWDAEREIVWRHIPDEVARDPFWFRFKSEEYRHDYGFTPFYWIQNQPCSEQPDGVSDFDGYEETCDEINRLLSSTTKGTIANVDPTLVIKMDPGQNRGDVLQKGSGNAIFSTGGAEYLELKGTSVATAERQIDRLVAGVLDGCGVVLTDPEKLSGAAQSARALEILYAPMLATCDTLREQYGDHGIRPIVRDMLIAARALAGSPPVPDPDTGELTRPAVMLSPRIEKNDAGEDVEVERDPGMAERVVLNWPPYFPVTWQDIGNATRATKEAAGGKSVISHRTAVSATARMFGVEDVDEELAQIAEDNEKALAQAQAAMMSAGPMAARGDETFYSSKPAKSGGLDEDDEDEDEDDDEGDDE